MGKAALTGGVSGAIGGAIGVHAGSLNSNGWVALGGAMVGTGAGTGTGIGFGWGAWGQDPTLQSAGIAFASAFAGTIASTALSKGYQAAVEKNTAGEAAEARMGSVKMTEDPNALKSSLKFGGIEVDGGKLAYAEFRINHALHGEGEYNPVLAVKTAYELWGTIPDGGLRPVDTLGAGHAAEAYRENRVIGVDYTKAVYAQGTRELISMMLHESTHVGDFQSGKYDGLSPKLMGPSSKLGRRRKNWRWRGGLARGQRTPG